MLIQKVKAVVFDLDNVLFNEMDYIFEAYREIARFLAKQGTYSEANIFEMLHQHLKKKGTMYPKLFNDVVLNLGLSESLIPELLQIYSGVQAKITLNPEAERILQKLRDMNLKLGLVTNGAVLTQKNKVRLLGIEKYFDVIVYAREFGKEKEKPHLEPYRAVLGQLKVLPQETLCIGDNPHTDFIGAKQIGMATVRILVGEFKETILTAEYEADTAVNSFSEIYELID